MAAFDFTTIPRIVFGAGQISRLPDLVAPLGSSALLVHNVGAELVEQVGGILNEAGISHVAFEQSGEPKVTDIGLALAAAKSGACDLVLGLGGGSAIDTAKAVAGLLTNGGEAIDYMEVVGKGRKIVQPAAPWIAIPTTAGTGAEATRNAVIGYPEKHFKASIRSEHLLARIALIDPQLAVGVPPAVTASSGMDALCQNIEAYTSTGAQPLTDALAMKGMALAARALPRACANGTDIDARSDMALAALFSGIALANAGLGAVHGFAAPMGANFPIPHGTVCAVLLPQVIRVNVDALRERSGEHPTLVRYADVGRALAGDAALANAPAIEFAIQCTRGLVRDLRIPPLAHFGFGEADIPGMVALARRASSMKHNPVVLSDEALAGILHAAWE